MSDVPIENIPARVITIIDEIVRDQLILSEFKYRFERGSNTGDGYIGIIIRVCIEGVRPDGQSERKSLICKYQSSDKEHRNTFNSAQLFAREVFVYSSVLPEFEKIQSEYEISREDGFFAYPKCYHASGNVTDTDIVLIFEDMVARDFVMDPAEDKYDIEHIQHLYVSLGRFHALSFALRFHKPQVFEGFKQMDDLLHTMMSTETLKPMAKKNVQLSAAILETEEEHLKQKVLKYENCLWDEMGSKVLDGNLSEPYSVVAHGDCWVNNLMFRYDKTGSPAELILLDYQHTRYCSPAIDVVYFPFLCSSQEFRNQYMKHLIEIYYKSFEKLLRQLGANPNELFSYGTLEAQLKRFGIIGFGMGTFTTPLNCRLDVNNVDECGKAFRLYKIRMGGIIRDIEKFDYFG